MSERKVVGKKYEYQTNDKLGSGAFAEVYLGKNKLTQEAVAIKVIKRAVLAKYGYGVNKIIKWWNIVINTLGGGNIIGISRGF